MYAKFLVRQLSSPIQLDRLWNGLCRSFGSTPSTLNVSSKRSADLLLLPSVDPPPSLSGNPCPSLRKLHVGIPYLMNESEEGENEGANISYSVVPKEKSMIVSKFLISYYYKMEPISLALGMPLDEIGQWFHDFIRTSMFASVTDVCIQAVDEKVGKRVGILASIIVDPTFRAPANRASFLNPEKHPVNTAVVEFYDKLEEGISEANFGASSKTLEHMFISIDPNFGEQGVASKMVDLAESIAATIINCRVGYVVTTSEFGYKIYQQHGYEVAREIKYADYTNSQGEKIFADKLDKMQPHTACRAMVKKLKNHYDYI